MNLTTFRSRVQSTTGLAGSTAGAEQTLVDGWVNEGVEQFLLRTKVVKKTATLALTVGQGDYTIDPEVLALEDLYVDQKMLRVTDTAEIRKWRIAGTSTDNTISWFAYEAQVLMLYPTPTVAGQLHIIYVPRPDPMTSPAHDPSTTIYGGIPAEYHPVIEAYAKWKAAEYANDQPSQNGQMFKQEYEAGVVASRIYETRKAGVNVRRATPGPKTSGVGISPGVDRGY